LRVASRKSQVARREARGARSEAPCGAPVSGRIVVRGNLAPGAGFSRIGGGGVDLGGAFFYCPTPLRRHRPPQMERATGGRDPAPKGALFEKGTAFSGIALQAPASGTFRGRGVREARPDSQVSLC
jgi:hypothetical protein